MNANIMNILIEIGINMMFLYKFNKLNLETHIKKKINIKLILKLVFNNLGKLFKSNISHNKI